MGGISPAGGGFYSLTVRGGGGANGAPETEVGIGARLHPSVAETGWGEGKVEEVRHPQEGWRPIKAQRADKEDCQS